MAVRINKSISCLNNIWLITMTVVFLSAFTIGRADAAGELKVTIETENPAEYDRYSPLIEELAAAAVADLPRYRLVQRSEARYIIKIGLIKAEEIIVDGVPTADVGLVLRLIEIDPATGRPLIGDLANATVSRRFIGSSVEKALRELVPIAAAALLDQLVGKMNAPGGHALRGHDDTGGSRGPEDRETTRGTLPRGTARN